MMYDFRRAKKTRDTPPPIFSAIFSFLVTIGASPLASHPRRERRKLGSSSGGDKWGENCSYTGEEQRGEVQVLESQ